MYVNISRSATLSHNDKQTQLIKLGQYPICSLSLCQKIGGIGSCSEIIGAARTRSDQLRTTRNCSGPFCVSSSGEPPLAEVSRYTRSIRRHSITTNTNSY